MISLLSRSVGAITVVLATAAACGTGSPIAVAMVPSSFTAVTEAVDRARGSETEWIIAGSSRLVRQLADGADADLLITADQETMQRAFDDGLVDLALGVVARNRLVLAVAPGNPAGVDSLDDLADADLLIGVCASEVPCGRLAIKALTELGLTIAADTEEANVRSLALKISRGELDAGLIYATDAQGFSLDTVSDSSLADFVTEYPAASVAGKDSAVVDFLRSPDGQTLLTDLGFTLP